MPLKVPKLLVQAYHYPSRFQKTKRFSIFKRQGNLCVSGRDDLDLANVSVVPIVDLLVPSATRVDHVQIGAKHTQLFGRGVQTEKLQESAICLMNVRGVANVAEFAVTLAPTIKMTSFLPLANLGAEISIPTNPGMTRDSVKESVPLRIAQDAMNVIATITPIRVVIMVVAKVIVRQNIAAQTWWETLFNSLITGQLVKIVPAAVTMIGPQMSIVA